VTNIIKYSYHYLDNKPISVKAELLKDRIIFSFYDWGQNGFCPPKNISQPNPGQLGQYGLYIIECMVDDVIYSRDETGRNCCCLIVKR
jgi:anti-sigma regulatory factor (Ser/Thr protein kinase)